MMRIYSLDRSKRPTCGVSIHPPVGPATGQRFPGAGWRTGIICCVPESSELVVLPDDVMRVLGAGAMALL